MNFSKKYMEVIMIISDFQILRVLGELHKHRSYITEYNIYGLVY